MQAFVSYLAWSSRKADANLGVSNWEHYYYGNQGAHKNNPYSIRSIGAQLPNRPICHVRRRQPWGHGHQEKMPIRNTKHERAMRPTMHPDVLNIAE